MSTINIAIIEKSPLAKIVLEAVLSKANFNVTVNTESIHHFLGKAKEGAMASPDICLVDATTLKKSSISSIRNYYPDIKIALYDPVGTRKKNILRLDDFDVYMSRSLKLEQWIMILQNIVNRRH
jgi:hypothetical protein